MPQLDPSTFASQLFWLTVTFIPLFIILWKVALPRISATIETRRARIEADLDKAAALRDDAARALAEYEKSLASAHEKARDKLRQLAEELAAQSAERHAALGAKLAAQIKEAEARVTAAKDQALANIKTVAGEAAAAATERLIGVKASGAAIEKALAAVIGEKP